MSMEQDMSKASEKVNENFGESEERRPAEMPREPEGYFSTPTPRNFIYMAEQEGREEDSYMRMVRGDIQAGLSVLHKATLDAAVMAIDELEANARRLRREAADLLDAARSAEARAGYVKGLVQGAMGELGVVRTDGWVYRLTRRRTERVRTPEDAQGLVDLANHYPELVREKIEPDKQKIKAAIKAGCQVEGCALEADYSLVCKSREPWNLPPYLNEEEENNGSD